MSSATRMLVRYSDMPIDDQIHAIKVMKDLGIEFKSSKPQTLYDGWEFFKCTNIPDVLPKYVINCDKRIGN